jgi:hypothetical protein
MSGCQQGEEVAMTGPEIIRVMIDAMDLTSVRYKMQEKYGWEHWLLDLIETQYRQFLYLMAIYGDQVFVPWSENLDLFWHQHILDTRKYHEDCHRIFGRYVHHNPHVAEDSLAYHAARARTRELFLAEFATGQRRRGKQVIASRSIFTPRARTTSSSNESDGLVWMFATGFPGDPGYSAAPSAADGGAAASDGGASCGASSCGGSSCGGGGCGGGGCGGCGGG